MGGFQLAENVVNVQALIREELDLRRLGDMLEFRLVFHRDETSRFQIVDLRIQVVYKVLIGPPCVLELTFSDVRQMRLPEIGGGSWFDLSDELSFEDIRDHGLESIRFRVEDFGQNGISLFCRRVALTGVFRFSHEGLVQVWQS